MKIYKRKGTWIMIGAMVLVVTIAGLAGKFLTDNEDSAGNWQQELQARNQQLSQELEQVESFVGAGSVTAPIREEILLNEYRLENNIPPVEDETLWGFMISSPEFTAFASLFAIVIGAGVVANEFTTGTIKLLLIRPVNRWKILLSKFLATLLFALVLVLTLFASSFIVGSILYGFDGITLPYLVYADGEFIERHMITQILMMLGFSSINLIMMTTFAFMVSTVFRSSSLAIGLSLFLMFTGQQLVVLLSQYEWVKYILFANTDLTQYVSGTPLVEGMTMTFSVIVLVVYFLIFLAASVVIFDKRDVAA